MQREKDNNKMTQQYIWLRTQSSGAPPRWTYRIFRSHTRWV